MGFGDAAGHGAVERQQVALREDRARRDQARIGRARQRRGGTEVAGEPMVCPACTTRYPFGSSCPDCAVELVGLSLLGKVEATPVLREVSPAEVLRQVLVVGTFTVVSASVWIWLLWGGGVRWIARSLY